jgi:hypothetical protein
MLIDILNARHMQDLRKEYWTGEYITLAVCRLDATAGRERNVSTTAGPWQIEYYCDD